MVEWQTRMIQVHVPRGMRVRVPPGAPKKEWPLRLSARTSGSHPGKRSSTLLGAANFSDVMRVFLRVLLKTMKWTFIVFSVFIASLFFRDQKLPVVVKNYLCEKYSIGGFVFRVDEVYFGFRSGVKLKKLSVFSGARKNIINPLFSAESVAVDFLSRKIKINLFQYSKLPDSYYASGNSEVNAELGYEFPEIGNFSLELDSPIVLGLNPKLVTAEVTISKRSISVTDICIIWPGLSKKESLFGSVGIDLDKAVVNGEVSGHSSQSTIRPFLQALDLPLAVEYMDLFTDVKGLVPAKCAWNVSLEKGDLKLSLDLSPRLGKYRNVPIEAADGRIDIECWTRGTNFNYRTKIGPLRAVDPYGGLLNGSIVISGSRSSSPRIEIDAESTFRLEDVLVFSEVISSDILGDIKCIQAPKLTTRGVLATSVEDQAANDLIGSVSLQEGSIFGIKFKESSFNCSYRADNFQLTNIVCLCQDGTIVNCAASLSLPELDEDKATFNVKGTFSNGTLSGLLSALAVDDIDDRYGEVEGRFDYSGPMNSNCVSRLSGSGSIKVKNGRIAQLNLFAGLTELLAEKVPGVTSIINQSDGSCDYRIKDGVLKTENLLIEGNLFSVIGSGSVDLTKGELDFLVRVRFFRKDSILAAFVHPITWAFSKLLLELHLTGTFENPKWEYLTVIDKVL